MDMSNLLDWHAQTDLQADSLDTQRSVTNSFMHGTIGILIKPM